MVVCYIVFPLLSPAEPSENLREILQNVAKPHGVSNMRKLGHLNNFIKVMLSGSVCCCLYKTFFFRFSNANDENLMCSTTSQERAGLLSSVSASSSASSSRGVSANGRRHGDADRSSLTNYTSVGVF